MPECKSCRAEIDFVETAKGAKMPVDANRIATVVTDDGVTVKGRLAVVRDDGGVVEGRIPHWVLCPGADEFRSR